MKWKEDSLNMKQKIDLKLILLFITISVLLISTSSSGLLNGTIITSLYDLPKYLLLIVCVIGVVNVIRRKRKGNHLSFKENKMLIMVSFAYLLVKIVFSILFKWLFELSNGFVGVFIILRYLLLTGYINYILLINQDNHSIKQIILNELFITLIIVVILLLLSIITDIKIIFLKEVLKVVVIAAVLIGTYILSLRKIY